MVAISVLWLTSAINHFLTKDFLDFSLTFSDLLWLNQSFVALIFPFILAFTAKLSFKITIMYYSSDYHLFLLSFVRVDLVVLLNCDLYL